MAERYPERDAARGAPGDIGADGYLGSRHGGARRGDKTVIPEEGVEATEGVVIAAAGRGAQSMCSRR